MSNTTTASVPGDRAGMASGIDMSARMISLAVNIALMGLILLAGITAHVRRSLPGALDAATLRALAERIAAGDLAAGAAGQVAGVARGALAQGFEWVMLYGGLGAWPLAGLSWLTFAPRARPGGAVAAPPSR
ncbi:hypothetical protein CSQ96_27305 [Janthinobacterium sp. BJB412]|nr:hypothetical protein CSQ96_27305 [Janthinobacterium sp. BJB412]